jgi:hypothetical protein
MNYDADDPLVLFGVVRREHGTLPQPPSQHYSTAIPPPPVQAPPSAPLQTQMQVGAADSSSNRVIAAVQPPKPSPTDCSQRNANKPKRKLTDLSAW